MSRTLRVPRLFAVEAARATMYLVTHSQRRRLARELEAARLRLERSMTDAARDRAKDRRRHAVARLGRLKEDDGSFDRDFWKNVPAGEKMQAIWQMTLDYLALTDPNGHQPRLRRHIRRIQRGRR